ncbi:MAG: transglutaminase family protein [Bacteroidota bacterium]|jgi:regulator of sirC expression with transglutaminase-like and TPR domain
MSQSDLHALIKLLDDPNEDIFQAVQTALEEKGESIIHTLEDHYMLIDADNLATQRLAHLIEKIQYTSSYEQLKSWKQGDQNLLEGILILNKYHQRNIPSEEITYQFSRIRQDIWLELNDRLTPLENIKVLNHILFKLLGFTGVSNELATAPHSLHDTLVTKTGTPLSLGTLYLLLAQSLDIPIYGVNLPGHFILCYVEEMPEWLLPDDATDNREILFYVNPYAGGTILDHEEVEQFILNQHLPLDPHFFEACSNRDILIRHLNAFSHHNIALNQADKVRQLQVLLSLLLELED